MRPWSIPGQVGGAAALVAMLLLSGPGVRLVHADEMTSGQVPAPVCEAGEEPDPAALQSALARLAQQEPRADAPEVIVLDNSGYNYETRAQGDVDALVGDLMRVRTEP
jgi:hypothetical protein